MKLDRKVAPAIVDAVNFEFTLPECHQEIGANKIPLYWLQAGAQEVIQISWVFEAGIWNEYKTAVSQATSALLKNGTIERTAFDINEAIEFYGASVKVSTNNDYTTISLHSLSKHIDAVLPIVADILFNAQFPQHELDIYKQNALQRLSVNLMKSEFIANRNIDAMLFGKGFPYGKFTEAEDVTALTREDLIQFYQENFTSANCRIFIAGNYPLSVIASIKNTFCSKDWGTPRTSTPEHILEPSSEMQQFIQNDEQGVQGAIRIARRFINRNHPEFVECLVLNTILGGYFGSRLMENIREEKGYTYGIYSNLLAYKHECVLMIATEAGSDVCQATMEEVYKEMKRLQEELIDEDELNLVKNYILGGILGDLEGPFSIMQRWKSLILNGLDERYFYSNIETYKNITSERLQALAQKYLNKEDFYELLVI